VMTKPEPSILFSSYANKKITLSVYFWIAPEKAESISEIMHGLYTNLPNAELTVKDFAVYS
jgi:small-conductance mechanosensitive channel